ncbi:MAG: hypothetical protein LUD68_10150 [Rikenellaceae bacterium]|nr:hypothetical protein [Rikenellaceae bacterium]
MKPLFLLLWVCCTTGAALSQTIYPQELLTRLAQPDPLTGAQVVVRQNGELAGVLNRARSLEGIEVDAYRVYIFLDNTQNARSKGQQTLSQFQRSFPDIPAEISYENPYWKVAVGNCLSKDEAMIVFGRVKGQFPSAFVRTEKMPLKNLFQSADSASEPEWE